MRGHKNVRRLDVEMNVALLVRRPQSVCDLNRQHKKLFVRNLCCGRGVGGAARRAFGETIGRPNHQPFRTPVSESLGRGTGRHMSCRDGGYHGRRFAARPCFLDGILHIFQGARLPTHVHGIFINLRARACREPSECRALHPCSWPSAGRGQRSRA